MAKVLWKTVMTALAVGASGQCGPDQSQPYPPGESTCPDGPSDGASSGSSSGGSTCDATGGSATYSETIDTSGSISARKIDTTGCPNHYSMCTGKGVVSGCGAVGSAGTASEATDQSRSLTLPAMPVLRTEFGISGDSDVGCEMGAIAIALNGVAIYGGAVDTSCTAIDVDSIQSEWNSFDCCSGHSQQQGDYHYHFPPSCLLAQIGDLSDGHSPQIGWAYDGFPIYGPKGPGGIDMKYGGSYGSCTGDYCLDVCGGLEKELPSVDKFKYRYYIVGATSDLSTLPGNPKPAASASAVGLGNGRASFTINCYRGYTYSQITGGASGSSGVASDYVAAATSGVTTKFAPDGLCSGEGITSVAEADNGFCSDFSSSSCNSAYAGVGASSISTPSPTPSPTPAPAPSPSPAPSPTPTPAPTTATTTAAATTATEVELTLTVDDATAFSQAVFVASLAEAAEAEADQVEVTEVAFQVAVGYRFPASMTEDTAQNGLASASGQSKSRVSVKRRARAGGRRLLATTEMDVFDVNFTAENASGVASLASMANDTSLITDAMVLEGVENFTMEVVEAPTKKIRVKSKMRPKKNGDSAPSAPSREKMGEKLGKKMGQAGASIDGYTSKGPTETPGGDNAKVSHSMRMGQFSVLALGALTASLC